MHLLISALGYDQTAFLRTTGLLALAFLFGGMIGLERQIRQRNAGLRTMVLVVVGATAFVHLGFRLMNLDDGQQKALVAFLKTLTDHKLIKDSKYSDPFRR